MNTLASFWSAFFPFFWKTLRWVLLFGALVYLTLNALADPPELPPNPWDGPAYVEGQWRLTGIVEHRLQTQRLFEQELDLVELRFGGGSLWALAGVAGKDGQYESLVDGANSREEVQEVFSQPRYVTLGILGTPKAVDHAPCVEKRSARCQVTALVEGSRPPIILDPDEEPTGDLSNVFIHTGVFPPHYLYGFLTWDIQPGQVIEQGFEGG